MHQAKLDLDYKTRKQRLEESISSRVDQLLESKLQSALSLKEKEIERRLCLQFTQQLKQKEFDLHQKYQSLQTDLHR
jgi:hypothetical protein